MKTWPTLYKKSSTGAIQEWTISAGVLSGGADVAVSDEHGYTKIRHGQVGGKLQETVDVIREGKNAGKVNETSPVTQAMAEAEAKWIKQKKKGYVESAEGAEAGELDALITGGIAPMLAHKFADCAEKFKFPAACQYKYDGVCILGSVVDGVATLWSRTRKPIASLPHIQRALEAAFPKTGTWWVHGEGYNHFYRNDFEKIISLITKKGEPDPEHRLVKYYIYDAPSCPGGYETRYEFLKKWVGADQLPNGSPLVLAPTDFVDNEDEMMDKFQEYVALGFEGLMARDLTTPYENKRSRSLLKVKEFLDEEFKIVGIEEGRGKLTGHVGAFVCQLPDGREFRAKPMGVQGLSRQYFEDHSLWQDKRLTVKFQGYTKEGIPRFPVGKAIRDYE